MALTQSSVPTGSRTNPPSQSPTTHITLPPPQTFDILPQLHELLARVDHPSLPPDPTTTTAAAADNDDPDDLLGARYAEVSLLDPKDLPHEVLPLKAKIRKAQRELEKLPDMHRSINEQREEIAALEERVMRQREMLRRVAEVAKSVKGRVHDVG